MYSEGSNMNIEEEMEMAVVKKGELPSVIHNNECSEAIVKWGNENGYPLIKAKMFDAMGTYVGFSKNYFIRADRRPPIPGGWDLTVEECEPETRIIPLNTDKDGVVNRFVLKMVEEFEKEGLEMKLADTWYDSYGNVLRDLSVTGHPLLITNFEDIIENMR